MMAVNLVYLTVLRWGVKCSIHIQSQSQPAIKFHDRFGKAHETYNDAQPITSFDEEAKKNFTYLGVIFFVSISSRYIIQKVLDTNKEIL